MFGYRRDLFPDRPRPRPGGAVLVVATDLLRHALARRSWLPLLVVLAALLAAALVVAGHAVAPWAIYPAL